MSFQWEMSCKWISTNCYGGNRELDETLSDNEDEFEEAAGNVKHNMKKMHAITAFLQDDLAEEIYIEQLEGFSDESGPVCK